MAQITYKISVPNILNLNRSVLWVGTQKIKKCEAVIIKLFYWKYLHKVVAHAVWYKG